MSLLTSTTRYTITFLSKNIPTTLEVLCTILNSQHCFIISIKNHFVTPSSTPRNDRPKKCMTPRKNSLIDYSPVCISSSDDDIFCILRKLWKLSKPSFKLKVQEIRGQRKYETTYESCAVPVYSASFCSNGNGSNMLCRCFRFLFLSPLSQSLVNLDLFYVMTLDWHVKDSSANSALPVATKMASFPEADFLPTQLQRALHCAPSLPSFHRWKTASWLQSSDS